jgi:hypothetical protein
MRKIMLMLWMPLICGCGENWYTDKAHPLSGVWNLFGVPSLSAEEIEIRQELQREARLTQIFSRHPEWLEKIKQCIKDKKICIGMTPEQVELAWDCRIIREYASSSGREMYEESGSTSVGGYSFWFYNGKLEDWSWTKPVYLPSYSPPIDYLSPDGEWYGY